MKAKTYRGNEFTLVDALSTGHHESDRLSDATNLPYKFVDESERLLPDENVKEG